MVVKHNMKKGTFTWVENTIRFIELYRWVSNPAVN